MVSQCVKVYFYFKKYQCFSYAAAFFDNLNICYIYFMIDMSGYASAIEIYKCKYKSEILKFMYLFL